ncbi:MAG TPA: DUF4037 domain-containing protein [Candidatus Latescibacteria bacterium]|jgi:hypothetical protein|nr:DUF4037 domain-containing protein [Candidatus Latescibacterota bacterium]MDP7634551.1 DUF4037 domain-containing protein [Candidatus Latescibacterota bacterium]HCV24333.1 hypothetical protein [Candidatus Latescibacterota bacterium]HJN27512.1 DUF4037 domain-containing protein [Candidatus Latescibacterota bacterium]|tara:strand:- start:1784 stop:2836 length:1053 start_codon:yes stop_codon:yes gene_type:complete
MSTGILDTSRAFFEQVVLPLLRNHFPEDVEQMACGFLGYGSECLEMDDELSRDHHWGLRVDILLPGEIHQRVSTQLLRNLVPELPDRFAGISLRDGHVAGHGIAPESLPAFLRRTIGVTHAPRTNAEWLDIPEVDIIHVTNGQVWHDPSGELTTLRRTFDDYYPEPVWLRRIAHWCRYASGMGIYALNRAVLRGNEVYAWTAFSRSLKWSMELAFLLNRTYFPYDKWLLPFFRRLPHLADRMDPLIVEGVKADTSWERRIELLAMMADMLDERMVKMGVIPAHPAFEGSDTSSYRLLEHAYGAILQKLPEDVVHHVPCWDQIPLEEFHTGYVATLPIDEWDSILNLKPLS